MTSDAIKSPPRPDHEEILKNERVRDDHVIDVLSICQNIMRMIWEDIESGLFKRGGDEAFDLAHSILTDT